jgi:hypothetical protein
MAGFLDRLAARALGTAAALKPVVQPRVPVSFGPVHPVAEPAPGPEPAPSAFVPPVEDARVEPRIEIAQVQEPAQVLLAKESVHNVVSSTETVRVEKEQTRTVMERHLETPIPIVIPRVEPALLPAVPAAVLPPKPSMSAVPPAGPVVKVSIGRIDVRAEFAPAAPARVPVRASAPALSLEAYRRQRDGGLR